MHEAIFTPTEPGLILCAAQNVINDSPAYTQTKAHVILGDIPEDITILGLEKEHNIASGDEETFTCAALAYHFDGNLEWFHNGEPIVESDGRFNNRHLDHTNIYCTYFLFRYYHENDQHEVLVRKDS